MLMDKLFYETLFSFSVFDFVGHGISTSVKKLCTKYCVIQAHKNCPFVSFGYYKFFNLLFDWPSEWMDCPNADRLPYTILNAVLARNLIWPSRSSNLCLVSYALIFIHMKENSSFIFFYFLFFDLSHHPRLFHATTIFFSSIFYGPLISFPG